ncbi:MAG: serine/threonine protein kinase [Cyanothece sp. SIO1E1]|nr:serine/threonine protein kinase [Cyanothece sp. SIO1E1]
MELLHQPGDLISERYQVVGPLGQGGTGTTYVATDQQTGKRVALKELSLRGMSDWKQLELFEREAQVLAHLSHPAIPNYIDYFQVDTPENRLFYIVQELAAGESLATLVQNGWHADELEVRQIALQILEILSYLHRLAPPIIHRDIKPQNIIRSQTGQIFLVDFGAVQNVYRHTLTQSNTVVGTYGYMAPEQFRGQALPASDLYALGATLIFLLTHQSPADLPQQRLKIDFRAHIYVQAEFADWLETLVEPLVEDRFSSAREAIASLQGDPTSSQPLSRQTRQPAGSRIQLTKNRQRLILEIPPTGLRGETLAIGGFAIFWNGFILFWTGMAIASGAPIFFPLFSIPFWIAGLTMLGSLLFSLFGRTRLEINRETFQLQWQVLLWHRSIQGHRADLDRAELKTRYTQKGRPVRTFALVEGVRSHRLGSMLSQPEKEWLVKELNAFLHA